MPIKCSNDQGSDGWFEDRIGIPTASMYKMVVTSNGKASASKKTYMNQLLADWLAGKYVDSFEGNIYTETGNEREAEARDLYQLLTDNKVNKTGFWYKDKKRETGCSPDGLIGDDGLIEIKCPKASTLIGYKLANKMPSAYVQQVQGQLWVMDRQFCDFFVYHPDIDYFMIRVERDEDFITSLSGQLSKFTEEMLEKRKILKGGVS